jgi:hypothetical protein
MAVNIFLGLNALGVFFLLYVLANFLKDTSKEKVRARKCREEFGHRAADVIVVSHPVSRVTQDSISVIPFRLRGRSVNRLAPAAASGEAPGAPARWISTR